MELPSSKEFEKNILITELFLGDAVLFNFKIIHGSTGTNSYKSQKPTFIYKFNIISNKPHGKSQHHYLLMVLI